MTNTVSIVFPDGPDCAQKLLDALDWLEERNIQFRTRKGSSTVGREVHFDFFNDKDATLFKLFHQ